MIKPKQRLSSTKLSSEKEIEMESSEVVESKGFFDFYKESRKRKTASAS